MFILQNHYNVSMAKKSSLLPLVVLSFMQTASAADINGIWSTKDGCERLTAMAKDSKAAWQGNFQEHSYLSSAGIEGYEWDCKFIQSYKGANGETIEVSTCTVEGDSWPELLLVTPNSKAGWDVTVKGPGDEIIKSTFDTACRK